MKKIVLASTNLGKLKELKAALHELPIQLVLQTDFNIPEAEETASTFVENAIIKARHAASLSGLPALADDSGLCVDGLLGEPGIYSARYAGKGAGNAACIHKLLSEITLRSPQERKAHFHCTLVLLRHAQDPAPIICQGVWNGEILHEKRGEHGFGYDPIFYVPEYQCSAAELPLPIKNQISHRGQAVKALISILKTQV